MRLHSVQSRTIFAIFAISWHTVLCPEQKNSRVIWGAQNLSKNLGAPQCSVRFDNNVKQIPSSSSSSSSSYICHGVGPLVDPFRSHVSSSLSKLCHDSICQSGSSVSLPWVISNEAFSPVFTCCIQFLLYSSNLSKIGVIFNSFAICVFVL